MHSKTNKSGFDISHMWSSADTVISALGRQRGRESKASVIAKGDSVLEKQKNKPTK